VVAFGSEEQEGTEKLAGDKIDDEGWERGKNAADDQVFLSTRRFYRILPHIIPQRRMNRQMIFQGGHLSPEMLRIFRAKNKDANTRAHASNKGSENERYVTIGKHQDAKTWKAQDFEVAIML